VADEAVLVLVLVLEDLLYQLVVALQHLLKVVAHLPTKIAHAVTSVAGSGLVATATIGRAYITGTVQHNRDKKKKQHAVDGPGASSATRHSLRGM
jgi:nicotinamide mononucleotide (NMN) deamidase PncC